jgi:hypothetical protein
MSGLSAKEVRVRFLTVAAISSALALSNAAADPSGAVPAGPAYYAVTPATFYVGSYRSGYWYSHDAVRRAGVENKGLGGFDCFAAFQYGWSEGRKARFESTFCFDGEGRDFEVEETRAIAVLE